LLWLAGTLSAQEGAIFLSPLPDSAVPVGPLRIVAKGTGAGRLLIDGKPAETVSPAAGVFRAEVTLARGEHELALESKDGLAKIRVFSGEAHGGWKAFRQHPPAATCETCHAVRNGEWTLRRASLAPLCFTCHERGKFPLSHTHNTDILADCQTCHLPHGSQVKGHLLKPKELACKQCHS
jgi:predicted CXXCH cytochrome family protein